MIMRPLPYIPSSFRPNCPLSPYPLSLHSLTVTQASSHLDTQRLKSLLSQVPLLPPLRTHAVSHISRGVQEDMQRRVYRSQYDRHNHLT